MTVSPALDRRFRDAAAAEGLLDVAYELHDTPVGELLVAVTDRGVCEIHYDADPDAEAERLARLFGSRVLRSPLRTASLAPGKTTFVVWNRTAKRRTLVLHGPGASSHSVSVAPGAHASLALTLVPGSYRFSDSLAGKGLQRLVS